MDFLTHDCPVTVSEETDLKLLIDIVADDPRPCVKLLSVEIMTKKVLSRRTMQINRCILEHLYQFMRNYTWFVEMQVIVLDVINELCTVKGGCEGIKEVCSDLDTHLSRYERCELMTEKIVLCRSKLSEEVVGAAEILESVRKSETEIEQQVYILT